MHVSKSPEALKYPTAPEYNPLFSFSNSSIICIALILGAPLTVPAGKPAIRASKLSIPSLNSPFTSDSMCMTCEYISTLKLSVTSTLPGFETRPTSFLPKSSSIKCSALSFGSLSNSSLRDKSSALFDPLGLVPAIGLIVHSLFRKRTRISGEEPTTKKSLKLK